MNGTSEVIEPGKIVIIPANTLHSARALSDVAMQDLMTPVRHELDEIVALHQKLHELAEGAVEKFEMPIEILSAGAVEVKSDSDNGLESGKVLAIDLLVSSAETPYVLDGSSFSSLSSFITAIKLPENSSARINLMQSGSSALQDASRAAELLAQQTLDRGEKLKVYWGGNEYDFRSPEHLGLIRRAIEAKFLQNPEAADQLLLVETGEVVCAPGGNSLKMQSLTSDEYSEMLFDVSLMLAKGVVNIAPGQPGTKMLSNFTKTPFTLDGYEFDCGEAFLQAIKYREDDPRRIGINNLTGKAAQQSGVPANGEINARIAAGIPVFVYFAGNEIPYGSREHMDLIERALRAKYAQNEDAKQELLATGDRVLIREYDFPERKNPSLPRAEFARMMTSIREDIKKTQS